MLAYCIIWVIIGIAFIIGGCFLIHMVIKKFDKDDNMLIEIFGCVGSIFLFIIGIALLFEYFPKFLQIICGI